MMWITDIVYVVYIYLHPKYSPLLPPTAPSSSLGATGALLPAPQTSHQRSSASGSLQETASSRSLNGAT